MKNCPCGSGQPLATCCQAIIDTASAPTAEALMRSRYTAYYLGDADYLVATTHQDKRHMHNKTDIAQWSKENSWQRLEIISADDTASDGQGTVEFKAYFTDKNGNEQVLHERSDFKKEQGKWYYVDGVFNPSAASEKTQRNSPCPCGSGKKYKKCCGK